MKWSLLTMAAVAVFALAAPLPSASAQSRETGCVENNYHQIVKIDVMFWDNRPRIQTWVNAGDRKCVGPTDGSYMWVYAGTAWTEPGDGTYIRYGDGKSFDLIRVWKKGTKVTRRGVVDDIGFCRDAEC